LKEYWNKLEKEKKEKKIMAGEESLHPIKEVTK
jgi:hypothetical protein